MADRFRVLVAGQGPAGFEEAFRTDQRFLLLPVASLPADPVAAVTQAKPDIVVYEAGPGGQAAMEAVSQICLHAPYATVVVVTPATDVYSVIGFMEAGSDGCAVRPFRPDYLPEYAYSVHQQVAARKAFWSSQRLELTNPRRPRLIAVFSPKGGVGKTTVSTNLAVALAKYAKQSVVLVDVDLEAGDTGVVLDLKPKRTISDFVRALASEGQPDLTHYLCAHESGVQLLAAPTSPEQAELIQPSHLLAAFTQAKQAASFIVADTAPAFSDSVLTVLDAADVIVLVVTPDVTALKNVRMALQVMADLKYPSDKIRLVMNRCAGDPGLSKRQVEESLGLQVAIQIPNEPHVVISATNEGRPFTAYWPESAASRAIIELARRLVDEAGAPPEQDQSGTKRSVWKQLFRK